MSEGADSYGTNVIHVSTLQPLHNVQTFSYNQSTSGKHSPTSAAAAAAAAYNATDDYQYHHGSNKMHQESTQFSTMHGSSSSRVDPTLYSKVEVIPTYKSTLHGTTGQVYTSLSPPSSGAGVYDHTATLYSGTNPTQGTTLTYESTGGSPSLGGSGIVIGSCQ